MADEPRWHEIEVNSPEWERRVREEAAAERRRWRVFWTVVAVLAIAWVAWLIHSEPGAGDARFDDPAVDCEYDRPWAGGC